MTDNQKLAVILLRKVVVTAACITAVVVIANHLDKKIPAAIED